MVQQECAQGGAEWGGGAAQSTITHECGVARTQGERYANRISMLRVWLGFAG
jgi:hypothetical protein